MKKILIYFSIMALSGCDGNALKLPKYDVNILGYYIKKTSDDLYLFSRIQQCDDLSEIAWHIDTLTVDGRVYHHVFFAKIVPEKLYGNLKNIDVELCESRQIISNGDTLRKQVPGYGNRQFLVVEDVVGVQ